MVSLSLFFPLSIVLSFLFHLSVLANRSRCYPQRRSSGWRRGAALDPSPDIGTTIMSSSITHEHFWLIVFFSKLGSVFMCTSEMCHNQRSQELPQGAFSSQHVFPLAGYSFRRGSLYRKESSSIGMPPPTVPACVSFSVALL